MKFQHLIMNFLNLGILALVSAFSNNLFDIVYVNLESRTDRKQHMENLLGAANCKYDRFNAVNGIQLLKGEKNITEYTSATRFNEDIEKYRKFNPDLFGMAGCKLSHQIIWDNIAKTKKTKPTLIVEDDLDIKADFVMKVENALLKHDKKWDVILLSPSYEIKDYSTFNIETGLAKVGFFYECLAYIVKDHETAEKIIQGCYKFGTDFPVDLCIGNLSSWGLIEAYAFNPHLAVQKRETFGTNILSSEQTIGSERLENSLMEKYLAAIKN